MKIFRPLLISAAFLASWVWAASLAITPFANPAKDSNASELVVGMADSLSQAFHELPGWTVIDQYRIQNELLRQVAFDWAMGYPSEAHEAALEKLAGQKTLGDYLVCGSFQRAGGQVKLNSSVTRVKDGVVVGTVSVTGAYPDEVFKLQGKLASDLAKRIKAGLTSAEAGRLEAISKNGTTNYDAYRYYIEGMRAYFGWDLPSYRTAIGKFGQALKLDPAFPLALSGLAKVMVRTGWILENCGDPGARSLYDNGLSYGLRALEAMPGGYAPLKAIAESALHLGLAETTYPLLLRLRELEPEDAEVLVDFAAFTQRFPGYDKSIKGREAAQITRFLEQAVAVDPNQFAAQLALGIDRRGQAVRQLEAKDSAAAKLSFAQAKQAYEKAMALCPDNPFVYNSAVYFYLDSRNTAHVNPAAALALARKALGLSSERLPILLDTLAEACFANGKVDEAVKLEEEVVSLSSLPVFKKNLTRFREGN